MDFQIRRVFLPDFAENDRYEESSVRIRFRTATETWFCASRESAKVVFVINIHILDGQDGQTVESQEIFHGILLCDSCL